MNRDNHAQQKLQKVWPQEQEINTWIFYAKKCTFPIQVINIKKFDRWAHIFYLYIFGSLYQEIKSEDYLIWIKQFYLQNNFEKYHIFQPYTLIVHK